MNAVRRLPRSESSTVVARPLLNAEGRQQLKQLWCRVEQVGCKSLLVLPTSKEDAADNLASWLTSAGRAARGAPVTLMDVRGASVARSSELTVELSERVSRGECVVVVTDLLSENPVGFPLALACDGVLLYIALGKARFAEVRKTIEHLRPARILGCVAL